jgi:hypothetical protein
MQPPPLSSDLVRTARSLKRRKNHFNMLPNTGHDLWQHWEDPVLPRACYYITHMLGFDHNIMNSWVRYKDLSKAKHLANHDPMGLTESMVQS